MKVEYKFLLSTFLLVSFSILATTGILLLFEWSSSVHEFIKKIHIVSGIVTVIIVIFHFYTNFNLYKNEGKIFFKRKN